MEARGREGFRSALECVAQTAEGTVFAGSGNTDIKDSRGGAEIRSMNVVCI